MDLDEFSDLQIEEEYYRRIECLQESECTYCNANVFSCNCKMKRQTGKAIGISSDYCMMYRFVYGD